MSLSVGGRTSTDPPPSRGNWNGSETTPGSLPRSSREQYACWRSSTIMFDNPYIGGLASRACRCSMEGWRCEHIEPPASEPPDWGRGLSL